MEKSETREDDVSSAENDKQAPLPDRLARIVDKFRFLDGVEVRPTPDLCEVCGKKPPRTYGALTCLSCAMSGCVELDAEWHTGPDGQYARAFRPDSAEKKCDNCSSCGGHRHIIHDVDRGGRAYPIAGPCPGLTLGKNIELFNQSLCPARHHDATFDAYKTFTSDQEEAKTKLEHWSRTMSPGSKGWTITGTSGVGKTHLLVAISKRLSIDRGIRVAYVEWADLVKNVRDNLDTYRAASVIIEEYSRVPVLLMDELGRGADTEWRADLLDDLIGRRYRDPLLTTVLAMNPGDLEISTDKNKNTRMRLNSRILEITSGMIISGPDYRGSKYQEAP